jgi:hypothetical protein
MKLKLFSIVLLVFAFSGSIIAQYNLQWPTQSNNNTANFYVTCGSTSQGWTVNSVNTCFLYMPVLIPDNSENNPISYRFRMNQTGNGTVNDTLSLEVNISNTGWYVDTLIFGNTNNNVNFDITGKIQADLTNDDFIAFRLKAVAKTSSFAWTLKKDNFEFNVNNVTTTNNYLPVSLASFSGYCENTLAHIEWITYSELNNDYFTIERSENNRDFFAAGYIPGSGNSNIVQHYSFTDSKEIFSEITHYRLRQTDYDGTYQISNSIAVRKNNLKNQQMSYFIENSTVYLNYETLQDEDIKLEVFDVFGKQIDAMLLQAGKGANIVQWSFKGNDSVHGLYFMRIINSSSQIHFAKVVL